MARAPRSGAKRARGAKRRGVATKCKSGGKGRCKPAKAQLLGRHDGCGAVAQMGERCNRTAEVRSSILLSSTTPVGSSINSLATYPSWSLAAGALFGIAMVSQNYIGGGSATYGRH